MQEMQKQMPMVLGRWYIEDYVESEDAVVKDVSIRKLLAGRECWCHMNLGNLAEKISSRVSELSFLFVNYF